MLCCEVKTKSLCECVYGNGREERVGNFRWEHHAKEEQEKGESARVLKRERARSAISLHGCSEKPFNDNNNWSKVYITCRFADSSVRVEGVWVDVCVLKNMAHYRCQALTWIKKKFRQTL